MESLIAAISFISWAFAALLFVGLTCCVVALVKQEIETQQKIATQNQNQTLVPETETHTALVPMAGILDGGPFPLPVVTIHPPITAPRRFPTYPTAPRMNRPTLRQQIADDIPDQIPDETTQETDEDDDQQIAAQQITQETQSIRIPRRSYRLSPQHPPLVIHAHDGRWVLGRPGPYPRNWMN